MSALLRRVASLHAKVISHRRGGVSWNHVQHCLIHRLCGPWIPLGAVLFTAFGRHPATGLAAAFAGVSGGWSANLLIGTNDPMFAGMSTQAARMIDPEYTGASRLQLVFHGGIHGAYHSHRHPLSRTGWWSPPGAQGPVETGTIGDIGENERRGMGWAGITVLVYAAVMALLTVLPGGTAAGSPNPFTPQFPIYGRHHLLYDAPVPALPGLAYGIGAGTLKNSRDAVALVE